jgi:hypothetical protein
VAIPRRAVAGPVEEIEPPAEREPRRVLPKLTREKRVLLAPAEEREVESLVARIADEVGTPVKLSHVLRACVAILCHAEDEILRKARQAAPLTRPPNGDPLALVQFEHEIARIVSAGLRNASPLR